MSCWCWRCLRPRLRRCCRAQLLRRRAGRSSTLISAYRGRCGTDVHRPHRRHFALGLRARRCRLSDRKRRQRPRRGGERRDRRQTLAGGLPRSGGSNKRPCLHGGSSRKGGRPSPKRRPSLRADPALKPVSPTWFSPATGPILDCPPLWKGVRSGHTAAAAVLASATSA